MTGHHPDEPDGDTMRAIRVHEFGGPEKLIQEVVTRPKCGGGELLVRVRAAGVNPIDWMIREGYTDEALDPSLPWIPGWDLSGVVEDVGDGVSRFEPGDPVFGMVRMPDPGSTYAEYATVPETEVVEKPSSLTHAEAAALPMVSLTAWRALFGEGSLSEGDRVLVHAAAGGVGHVAVQLATAVGAHVVGTASARNQDFLRGLGVDEFVDYRNDQFETVVDPVDVVLDAVGGDTLERSLDVVRRGGDVVTLPTDPPESLVERARTNHEVSVRWFSVEPGRETLSRIVTRVNDGELVPTVSEVYPLSNAGAAQRRSESGHVRGKLVLEPVRSTG